MIINTNSENGGIAMRKALIVAIVLSLVFGVSMAYACGEKKTSAETAKAGLSNTGSACSEGKSASSVSKVSAGAGASVMTTESSDMCGAKVKHADYKTVSNSSGCCSSAAKANLETTSAGKANGEAKYCPASASSTAAHLRDQTRSEKLKTQSKTSNFSPGMVSISQRPAQ